MVRRLYFFLLVHGDVQGFFGRPDILVSSQSSHEQVLLKIRRYHISSFYCLVIPIYPHIKTHEALESSI